MTIKAKNRVMVGSIVMAVAALVVSLLPMLASSNADEVREIRLVTRDMTFYLEGADAPNPTIAVRAGERVRIVLRNDDAGMRHDFTINSWTVATRLLEDRGEQDTVTFRVPNSPGAYDYRCTPHAKMMSGTIRVE